MSGFPNKRPARNVIAGQPAAVAVDPRRSASCLLRGDFVPHKHPVVLLYVHPLLGEGIAAHVQTQTGVEVQAVSATDLSAVSRALAGDPRVIIFERSPQIETLDLASLAPHAVLIDVTETVGLGPVPKSPYVPTSAESLLAAMHPALAKAAVR